MTIQIVILAAGQGKRMFSNQQKVLHCLAGKPLLQHVLTTAQQISKMPSIVVHGHQGEQLKNNFLQEKIIWVEQKEQLGTGHAVLQALPKINDDAQVLILYGDVPLISTLTLKKLIEATPKHAMGILTAYLDQPTGYGRILRNENQHIVGVVEEKDANEKQRAIKEINPGIYLIPAKFLKQVLPTLNNHNAQQEYYLTDVIAAAVASSLPIHSVKPEFSEEILGVNDRVQLSVLERFYQRQLAEKFMREGVTIADPMRFDVRGDLRIGKRVTIDINLICEGEVTIDEDCVIGPYVFLRNVKLAKGVEVRAYSMIDGAEIGEQCVIGPYARIRPESKLGEAVHIGNFVEIKKTSIAEGSKINHLSYVGDAKVGKEVNVGAGTITCNYDGVNKHQTVIGDRVLIGSDTLLVAPVKVGDGATIGAGSIVTQDAPPNALTLTHRLEQRADSKWQRPDKIK